MKPSDLEIISEPKFIFDMVMANIRETWLFKYSKGKSNFDIPKKYKKRIYKKCIYLNYHLNKVWLVFIHKDKVKLRNFIKKLDEYKRKKQTKKLIKEIGFFCGYPKCCVDKFVELMNKEHPFSSLYVLNKLYRTEAQRNKLKELFDIEVNGDTVNFNGVINHLPCSLDCPDTIEQHGKRKKYFEKWKKENTSTKKVLKK